MKHLYSLLLWILRSAAFVGLLGLALKNDAPMALHFFFNQTWQAPVSVVLLLCFACGVVLGLTAFAGSFWRSGAQKPSSPHHGN